jgi:predicted RNase H-like HicB family nuclease
MNGYVVVFEGDEESGYSSYSPDLPGVVAAGETFAQTRELMLAAMIEHLAYLRETGQSVPEPITNARVTIVDVSAA